MAKVQEVNIPGIEKKVEDGIYAGLTLYLGENWNQNTLVDLMQEVKGLREAVEKLTKAFSDMNSQPKGQ